MSPDATRAPSLDGLPVVRSVYQPIVDLDDRVVVGYEALARGAAGTPMESPAALFGWAAEQGRLEDLDWACRLAAGRGVIDAGVTPGTRLFINVEPAALSMRPPAGVTEVVRGLQRAQVPVVLEITERALTADPAALLRFAERVRDLGWWIAVDDVGAVPASLAMMPFLAPEVVKLDLRLIQARTTVDVAQIVNAVNAQAARTGALVLAEGIETAEHEELARAMGAHLAQGWLYGRPADLPSPPSVVVPRPTAPVVTVATTGPDGPGARGAAPRPQRPTVPWDLVAGTPAVRRARKPLLGAMSLHLERQALTGDGPTVVVGGFQRARYFTPSTARRYAELAMASTLVAVLGVDMDDEPAPGVRGQALAEDDPFVHEWTVAVVSPHFAGALIARDCGDDTAEADRRFDYVVTYDRDVVLRAASLVLRRLSGGALPTAHRSGGPSRWDLMSHAVAATTNGITIADAQAPDLPLVYVNAAFERLTGYAAHEILGRNCRFLQNEDTDPDAVRRLRELVTSGQPGAVTLLNERPDGSTWWNEVHLSPVTDAAGVLTHVIGIQHDVTSRVVAERDAERYARTDDLTGLTNRTTGLSVIGDALRHVATVPGRGRVAVLFCDLDDFRTVNEEHGHQVGDQLLRSVAAGLAGAVRPHDTVFRHGGDEFVVVATVTGDAESATETLAERLHRAVEAAVRPHPVTVSIGVALAVDGCTPEELVREADHAMERAKQRRGGTEWTPRAGDPATAPRG
ncbi:diguanylate cyclase domain-containing protein [Thalassiella azotivora]